MKELLLAWSWYFKLLKDFQLDSFFFHALYFHQDAATDIIRVAIIHNDCTKSTSDTSSPGFEIYFFMFELVVSVVLYRRKREKRVLR